MWKTFQKDGELYIVKIEIDDNVTVYLSDLKEIWSQTISKEDILKQFQECNPLFDIKLEEATTEVTDLVNHLSDEVETEIIKNSESLELILKSTKSNVDVKFKFQLEKSSTNIFLKEVTVPLIQTVRQLEEQQKVLCNLIQKKDRELEEYKLEKGVISRDDLITEKFDETLLEHIDDKSMMNVFGTSKLFWNSFVEQHGDIKTTIEDVKKDPWNHIKRKRKVYSSKTSIKKGKGINYHEG